MKPQKNNGWETSQTSFSWRRGWYCWAGQNPDISLISHHLQGSSFFFHVFFYFIFTPFGERFPVWFIFFNWVARPPTIGPKFGNKKRIRPMCVDGFFPCILGCPPPSNSHHQDYYIFCGGSLWTFICHSYWEGGQPNMYLISSEKL